MLWRFVADGHGGGTWASEAKQAVTGGGTAYRGVFGAVTVGHDVGYSLGGYANSWVDSRDNPAAQLDVSMSQAQPGLISFNHTTKNWRNESTVAFTPPWGTYVGGVAEFVPGFGAEGLIVPLGGYTPLLRPDTGESVGYLDFANISVYDVATQRWLWQVATGDVPTARKWMCSVGTSQNESQGHEM